MEFMEDWAHGYMITLLVQIVLVLDIELLDAMSFAYSLDNYARIFIYQC